MTAKLFFLGQKRDLIHIYVKYKRYIYEWNGMPSSIPMDGMLVMEFATEQNDSRFYERITTINYKLYPMGYPLDEGEIIFYDASGDIIKRWKFADAFIKSVQNIFYTDGENPMMTYLVISPAIQNYGFKHTKSWNISDTEPSPYKTPIVTIESEKEYFVDKIEIQDLHEGSTNSGNNDKMGIIHDKEYTLKVLKFRNNEVPKNKNKVKWSYGYSKDNEVVVSNRRGNYF